jgi:ABC-type Fe3+ transport system permease subunit
MSRRQSGFLMLYTLAMVVVLVILHEAAHVLAAMVLGARFEEIKLGFMGINPSVTLPEWFTGTRQTVVHYAGGLAVGTAFLVFYLGYWMRKYRHNPNFFTWSLGAVTIMLSGMQFATGYLEGRYHAAYIVSAMSFISPTDVLTYGWAIAAVFFHSALCPWRKIRTISQRAQ